VDKLKGADMNKNPYYNNEGYPDPTAYAGTKDVIREETETEHKAFELIKVLKFIIRLSGFELIERIKIKDKKTGREFR
jgi:hypothetical protein